MKSLLKILFIIFFNSFSFKVAAQIDPTIPLQQRNLQNNIINPVINENPFIEHKFPQQKNQNIFKRPSNEIIKNQDQQLSEQENIEKVEEEVIEEQNTRTEAAKESNSSSEKVEKSEKNSDNDEGLFGAIRVGPMIGFGVINGPNLSLESKFWRYIGLSASYSFYNDLDLFAVDQLKSMLNSSKDFKFDTLKLSYWQYEGKISIFPFGGSFFIGAAFGKRQFYFKSTGTLNITIPNFSEKLSTPFIDTLTINSTYWTPQIGLLATWSGRFGWFAVGTEIGAQLTLNVAVENSINLTDPVIQPFLSFAVQSAEYNALNDQLRKTISETLKEYPIFYWNILKIGWIF